MQGSSELDSTVLTVVLLRMAVSNCQPTDILGLIGDVHAVCVTFPWGDAALLGPEGQPLRHRGHSAAAVLGGEGSEQMLLCAHTALNDAPGHFLLALVVARQQRQGLEILLKVKDAVQTSDNNWGSYTCLTCFREPLREVTDAVQDLTRSWRYRRYHTGLSG